MTLRRPPTSGTCRRHRRLGLPAAAALVFSAFLGLAACGGHEEATGETPPLLLVADHPVTSEAARRAGIVDDGTGREAPASPAAAAAAADDAAAAADEAGADEAGADESGGDEARGDEAGAEPPGETPPADAPPVAEDATGQS